MSHRGEVAVGIRIRQRAVLVESLLVVTPLRVVKAARVAAVMAGEDSAFRVDLAAERVAASFGINLESTRGRVISPDELPHRMHRQLVETRPQDRAAGRAPLARIEPTVRSPAQRIRNRVRVLQAEALQMNFGIAVRDVVMILVGIEEQIRWVHHPDAVAVESTARGDVQSIDERLVFVEHSVSVGVFVDRDLVETRLTLRRRRWDFVVDGSPEDVLADHLQPGRVRILQILHDPQPASLVPSHVQRLLDVRFGEHQFQLEVIRHGECLERLVRRHDRRVIRRSLSDRST